MIETDQETIIKDAVYHIKHSSNQVFEFGGLAGTGKSYTLNKIIESSGLSKDRVAAMSYIGQAAIVMRMKGFPNAKTAHSWLFHPEISLLADKENNYIMNSYYGVPEEGVIFKPKPLVDIDLIVIDEAYTMPLKMKSHIESQGIKIIATGDPGQLPPVKDYPAYLVRDDIPILTEIKRQGKGSPILYLADRARKGLPITPGIYGNKVLVIERSDLTDEMLCNSPITICGKNKTREEINRRVRLHKGYSSLTPHIGEKIICRKNNWFMEVDGISLANGLIGTVCNELTALDFENDMFKIDFKPDLLDCCFSDLYCDYNYFISDYKGKEKLKYDKYSTGEKFEWAYCTTTHLSQGAQYPYGIYIEEYLNESINNKLNYVGITRFVDSLIYVKPDRRYF